MDRRRIDYGKLMLGLRIHFSKKAREIKALQDSALELSAFDLGRAKGYEDAADTLQDIMDKLDEDEESECLSTA